MPADEFNVIGSNGKNMFDIKVHPLFKPSLDIGCCCKGKNGSNQRDNPI